MEPQVMKVSIPRNVLKSDDFVLSPEGGLSISKERLGTLVKENIGKVPDSDLAAISVGVVVKF